MRLNWLVSCLTIMMRILAIGSQCLSDMIQRDVLELNLSKSDETIAQKCCRADFSSVCDPLT